MFDVTRVVHFAEGASAQDRADLTNQARRVTLAAGATRSLLAPTLPGVINGGDLIWHLQFADAEQWHRHAEDVDSVLAASIVERIYGVQYRPGDDAGRLREVSGRVYRALLLRVAPGTAPSIVEQFERELLQMPRHIPTIRSWRLSRVEGTVGPTEWTHVWEQEFTDQDALEGQYLHHPIHWAVVDRWFDPECPDFIVRDRICHTYCALEEEIILQ